LEFENSETNASILQLRDYFRPYDFFNWVAGVRIS
jgi:hypothetical protein